MKTTSLMRSLPGPHIRGRSSLTYNTLVIRIGFDSDGRIDNSVFPSKVNDP